MFNLDVALSRSFQVRESHRLEARFEAFNSLNHVNFANPTSSLSSAQFGRITSAAAPRILQFAMKYVSVSRAAVRTELAPDLAAMGESRLLLRSF